ncbi:hypothetical protein [Aeoliella sp.]|uniref:hypothetical protein n=1 Tax=Aeoliella sp. TaxID=2795800 RepID=UPI003CCB9752
MFTRLSASFSCFFAIATACLAAVPAAAQSIPAFPGADGAAAYASGGRANQNGQIVYHVTTTTVSFDESSTNSLPGTLRYGLNNSNFPAGVPRTIVFDVGGLFYLGRLPESGWDPNGNGWDTQSRLTIGGTNVTLAGQTAPGAGVIFMGGGLKPQGTNNITRNITIASGYGMRNWWDPDDPMPSEPDPQPSSQGPGYFPDSTVYDGMDISGSNLMIDHVSVLYTTDEAVSMNENASDITVQYANISQGQNYPQWDAEGAGRWTGHALGSLLGAGNEDYQAAVTFHHNLYAHQKGRVPQLQRGEDGAFYDFRNNVFYNWLGTAGGRGGNTYLNLEGNFYLAGHGGDDPIGGHNTGVQNVNGGTSVMSGSSRVYRQGNLLDTNRDDDADDGQNVSGGASGPLWMNGVDTYAGVTENARVAYDRVLDHVGANWWTRDDVIDTPDERIIHETRTGTGKILAWADNPWDNDPNEGAEWRALKNTPTEYRDGSWDTEPATNAAYGVGDGMPTYWELQHGLDPNARDDAGDFDNDGYTNLEEYLNEIAAWPAPNAIVFNNANSDGRYEHILNWDANPEAGSVHPWQPSRFDTAVIDNGSVTIDSVGQHAGNLLLATNSGDNATLTISDGWIRVEDASHGLSDGMTVVGDHPDATATLNLAGGLLRTETLLKGAGGTFNFSGGILSADTVGFALSNDGGTLAPGESIGSTVVLGDLELNSGALAIELASPTEADFVGVAGTLTLGGDLDISLLDGFDPDSGSWIIATASAFSGAFDSVTPGFAVSQQGGDLVLSVAAALAGDYNQDGIVNLADYTVWRNNLGATSGPGLVADQTGPGGTPDGVVDALDYQLWKDYFGQSLQSASSSQSQVPEPSALLLMLGLLFVMRRAW